MGKSSSIRVACLDGVDELVFFPITSSWELEVFPPGHFFRFGSRILSPGAKSVKLDLQRLRTCAPLHLFGGRPHSYWPNSVVLLQFVVEAVQKVDRIFTIDYFPFLQVIDVDYKKCIRKTDALSLFALRTTLVFFGVDSPGETQFFATRLVSSV